MGGLIFTDFVHISLGRYPRLPQTPTKKKFLQKLFVKGPGYLSGGSCGWDLRDIRFLWWFQIDDRRFGKKTWSTKKWRLPCLKLTARPWNGWLEDDRFLLGQTAYFQVLLLLVSGRVAFSGLLSRARDMTSKPPTHHRIQKYQFSSQFVPAKETWNKCWFFIPAPKNNSGIHANLLKNIPKNAGLLSCGVSHLWDSPIARFFLVRFPQRLRVEVWEDDSTIPWVLMLPGIHLEWISIYYLFITTKNYEVIHIYTPMILKAKM